MDPRNRFLGMSYASLCSLAGRYNNPIPTPCLAPIDFLKILAQYLILVPDFSLSMLYGLPSFHPSLIPLNSYLFLHSSSLLTKEIFFPCSHFPYPSTMNSLHSSFSHELSPPSIFHHFSVLIHFPSSLSLFAIHLFLSLHLHNLISLLLSLSPYPFLLSFPSSLTHL